MKEKINNALGEIDEQFIDEALNAHRLERKVLPIIGSVAVVACAAAAVALAIGFGINSRRHGVDLINSGAASNGTISVPESSDAPQYQYELTDNFSCVSVSEDYAKQVYFGSEFPRIIYADSSKVIFTDIGRAVYCYNYDGYFEYEIDIDSTFDIFKYVASSDSETFYTVIRTDEDGNLFVLGNPFTVYGHKAPQWFKAEPTDSNPNPDCYADWEFVPIEESEAPKYTYHWADEEAPEGLTASTVYKTADGEFVAIENSGLNNEIMPGLGSHLPSIKIVRYAADAILEYIPFGEGYRFDLIDRADHSAAAWHSPLDEEFMPQDSWYYTALADSNYSVTASATEGAPVYAADDCWLQRCDDNVNGGKIVVIETADGHIQYSGLDNVRYDIFDSIKRGEIIGTVCRDNSGNSSLTVTLVDGEQQAMKQAAEDEASKEKAEQQAMEAEVEQLKAELENASLQDIVMDCMANYPFTGNSARVVFPLENSDRTISTLYGYDSWSGGMHYGIDIPAEKGTPFCSVADGVVSKADNTIDSSLGLYIIVNHGDFCSVYAHCNKVDVKEGDTVSAGQKLGEVGITGYAHSPLLHFEVRNASGTFDPLTLFPDESKPLLSVDYLSEYCTKDILPQLSKTFRFTAPLDSDVLNKFEIYGEPDIYVTENKDGTFFLHYIGSERNIDVELLAGCDVPQLLEVLRTTNESPAITLELLEKYLRMNKPELILYYDLQSEMHDGLYFYDIQIADEPDLTIKAHIGAENDYKHYELFCDGYNGCLELLSDGAADMMYDWIEKARANR